MIRRLAVCALLGWAATTARAEDVKPAGPPAAPTPEPAPPPTPEQAADAVLVAVKAKDGGALKALASAEQPDAWIVADELIRRREFDAADVLAKAAPGPDVEKLPEYIASRRAAKDDVEARAALKAFGAALDAEKWDQALAAVGSHATGESVVNVRLSSRIGYALRGLGRHKESAQAFSAAAEAADRIGWLPRERAALGEAATAAAEAADPQMCLALWERSLRLATTRGDASAVPACLVYIGAFHEILLEYRAALDAYERTIAADESLNDRAGAAWTRRRIGSVRVVLGQFSGALADFDRALKEYEEIGDRSGAAATLESISSVYYSLGDLGRSLALFERAEKEYQAVGNRAGAASALGNRGNVYFARGAYVQALEVYERALEEMKALRDAAGVATLLGNIGAVHSTLGDCAQALEEFRRALKMNEDLGDRATVAMNLASIGGVQYDLGNYEEALAANERSRKEQEALGARPAAAFALKRVGVAHYALGRYAQALQDFEQALREQESLGVRADAAATLECIGNAHLALHDPTQAVAIYERVLREQEDLGNRAGAASAHGGIALAWEALAKPAKALDAARRGLALLPTLLSGLGDEQGATARKGFGPLLDAGARAAAATQDVEQAWLFLEYDRAGALLESLQARDALRSAVLPATLAAAEAEARAKEATAVNVYRRSLDSGDLPRIRALRAEMESAQAAVGALVERIQREAKRAASVLYPTPASLEGVRATLGPDEALVLYALADPQALALVVTAREARIVTLPSSSTEVEAACDEFAPGDSTADSTTTAAALRKRVVEPLGLSEKVRRVLVSPEGRLAYVPFSLLLVDREVVYVPSGTVYRLLRDERDLRGDGVLALGDPDYATRADPRALAVMRGGSRLTPLPGTREEANALGTEILLGAKASEAGLRDALGRRPRWRAVHFACHGLVDAERPGFSSLALTPDAGDDGFLTTLEVFRSTIPADLVVLSACETAKGKIVKGEGIVGFTRAFLFAGSPRVISSLWKVDDDATRALMTKFYEAWNPRTGSKPMGTAAALRSAQDFVRSQPKWKHPYYWAAWVLWGLP